MPHPELQAVVDVILPTAQAFVSRQRGEFYPFGATMNSVGVVSMTAVQPDSDTPTVQDVLDLLVPALQMMARTQNARAVGLCLLGQTRDPAWPEPKSSIVMRLEHRDGDAMELIQTFGKRFLRPWKFDELVRASWTRSFYAA